MFKNIKIGIYGKGYWGKILHQNLIKISKIKFIAILEPQKITNKDLIGAWYTPDNTHYKLLKKF